MFTFLIPLYYIVSKLAEEKESKVREGMKMMGLKDGTYYFSWWVFFTIIICVMAFIVALMTAFNVFPKSNPFFLFMLTLLFGSSLFGFA